MRKSTIRTSSKSIVRTLYTNGGVEFRSCVPNNTAFTTVSVHARYKGCSIMTCYKLLSLHSTRLSLLCLLIPQVASAASEDLHCVKDLLIPGYTYVARRSHQGGTVEAVITIGAAGTASNIVTRSSDPNLEAEVRDYLRNNTLYDSGCSGKNVVLRFTFRLEGEAEPNPPVWVHFLPPNHFVIVSRPHKLMIHP